MHWLSRYLPTAFLVAIGFGSLPVQAQVAADGTVNTVVVPVGNTFFINAGETAGNNLFHSFQDFSLTVGERAVFNNDLAITNIFARVTGNTLSNIDGVIATSGTANLFLLNPNGVVFGPNAQLAIRGSFFASTADSIAFKDGVEFSAAQPNSILSISVPAGLQYGTNPGQIINRSTAQVFGQPVGLATLPGTTLGLVGGAVRFEGGIASVPNSNLELGAVGRDSFVDLVPNGASYRLNDDKVSRFADITLSQQAALNVLGNSNVRIRGDRVRIIDGAGLAAITSGAVSGGTIEVKARQLDLESRGGIASITTGTGTGAEVNLHATESVNLVGIGANEARDIIPEILQGNFTPGDAGTAIAAVTTADGAAGNITLKSPSINFSNGALFINTTFGDGASGALTLDASEHITVDSASVFSGTVLGSTGVGGPIQLDTAQLRVKDGGQIATVALGSGSAGSIVVTAADIQLSDTRAALPPLGNLGFAGDATRSVIASSTFNTGAAGDIAIRTQTLQVLDGAGISTSNFTNLAPNVGAAGNLSIVAADRIDIAGRSGDGIARSELTSSTTSTAPAGNISLSTGRLSLRDGASINTDSQQAIAPIGGQGGSIDITTRQNLEMTRSRITATTANGNGGDVDLNVGGVLLLRDNSLISTTAGQAGSGGNGGNITITAPFIVGVSGENSDITANAFTGNGGNIQISTNTILGLAFRPQLTPLSDITASSQFGVSGTVDINELTPDADRGVTALPSALIDPSQQIVSRCGADRHGSSLVVTGRGGLPDSPTEYLKGNSVWQDLRNVPVLVDNPLARRSDHAHNPLPAIEESQEDTQIPPPAQPFVEADGWRINQNGMVEFVSMAGSTDTALSSASCAARAAQRF